MFGLIVVFLFSVFFINKDANGFSVVRLTTGPSLVKCPGAKSCSFMPGNVEEKILENMELKGLEELNESVDDNLLKNIDGCYGTADNIPHSDLKPIMLCAKDISFSPSQPKKLIAKNFKIVGSDLNKFLQSGALESMMMDLLKQSAQEHQSSSAFDNIKEAQGLVENQTEDFKDIKMDDDMRHVLFKLSAEADIKTKHDKNNNLVSTGTVEANFHLDINPHIRKNENKKVILNQFKPLYNSGQIPMQFNGLKFFGSGRRIPSIIRIFPIKKLGEPSNFTKTHTAPPFHFYDSAYTNQATYDSTYTNQATYDATYTNQATYDPLYTNQESYSSDYSNQENYDSNSGTTTSKPYEKSELSEISAVNSLDNFTSTIVETLNNGVNKIKDKLQGMETTTTTIGTSTKREETRITTTTTITTTTLTITPSTTEASIDSKNDSFRYRSLEKDDFQDEFTPLGEDDTTELDDLDDKSETETQYGSVFLDE